MAKQKGQKHAAVKIGRAQRPGPKARRARNHLTRVARAEAHVKRSLGLLGEVMTAIEKGRAQKRAQKWPEKPTKTHKSREEKTAALRKWSQDKRAASLASAAR